MELTRSLGSLVKMAIRLQDGRSGVRFPVREINFSSLQNVQTGSGAHTASQSLGTGALSVGVIRTGLHLVSKLGVSEDTHPLPLHVIMAWTGMTSPLNLLWTNQNGIQRHLCLVYGRPCVRVPSSKQLDILTIFNILTNNCKQQNIQVEA